MPIGHRGRGVAASSPAFADKTAPPHSYKQQSTDGKFVFVMIASDEAEEDVSHWKATKAAEILEVRRRYLQSGLYRNDGSTTPLWTVNWYAYGVLVAADGVHLIRRAATPSLLSTSDKLFDKDAHYDITDRALEQEAFSFFENGRLLRTYQIGELVSDRSRLQQTVSHFHWLDKNELDDSRMEYRIRTKDGNQFAFDLRTGAIISDSRPVGMLTRRWSVWIPVVMLAGALVALSIRWRVNKSAPAV